MNDESYLPVDDFATKEDIGRACALVQQAIDLLIQHNAREARRQNLAPKVQALRAAFRELRGDDYSIGNWYE